MKTPPNRHISAIYTIIILMVHFTLPTAAFSQSKEFLRLRSTPQGTVPTLGSMTEDGIKAEYYIASGDTIEVFVWDNPDLSKEITIRGDGKMSYPLAGTFEAAGLSIDQLQDLIATKLGKFVRVPQVIISIKNSVGNKIIVLGQVNYPGIFTFKGKLSLIDAIAMAGDFTPDGRRESIMIISDNFSMHPKVRRVNALSAVRDGITSENLMLKPDDVIYVPRSTIADFNKFLGEIQPTLSTISNLLGVGTSAINTATQARAFFWHRDVKVIRGD